MDISKNTTPSKKFFYDKGAIFGGAYLGGPLVAIYFLAKNFKAIGEENKVKQTYIFGIIFTIILFGIAYVIPSEISNQIPKYLIPAIYTSIATGVFMGYQKQKIDELINHGYTHYSSWNVVGISLIGVIISLAIIFLPVYLSFGGAPSAGIIANTQKTYSYGVTKNKIYTNEGVTQEESDKMALNLEKIGLFSNESQQDVIFSNLGGKYEIHFIVIPEALNNQEFIQRVTSDRTILQEGFPEHIGLVLVDENDIPLKVIE